MARHRVIKLTVGFGLVVLVGLLLTKRSQPVPPKANATETATARGATAESDSPSPRTDQVNLVQTTQLNPEEASFQTSTALWHEKLSELYKLGEVFGPSGEEQFKKLQAFAESLPPADLPDAVRELQEFQKQNPTESGRELQSRLIRRWAENDVRMAAGWTTQMPAGSDRQEALANIASVWARQNFSEAATWAGQLADDNERPSVLMNVANEAVYTDPQSALKLAATLPSDSTRNDLITRATEVWAAQAPEDALAWAKQISGEALREQVIAGIAMTWGGSDPVAAAKLALNSLAPGEFQNKAVIAILQRWTLTDAPGATAWVNQFPEGTLREKATAVLGEAAKRVDRFAVQMPEN